MSQQSMSAMAVVGLVAFAAGLFLANTSSAFVASPPGLRGLEPAVQIASPVSESEQGAGATLAPATPSVASGVIGAAAASVALLALAARATRSSNLTGARQAGNQRQLVSLAAFENELGVQAPVGFWDPAGFTADGSVANFARRRQTEIKHGRISMLAAMGYITPELTGKLPGYLSPSAGLKFADVPNGLAAISKVPAAGWAQMIAYGAFVELSQDQSAGTRAAAGDFGFKVLTSSDPAEKAKKLSAEIANGRLSMMAIIGMFFQDGLTGSAWGDWALYTASPLRAFENELGVQAPVGFWDPAGFTADGSVANFARRRQTEIKHGRISMLAAMGYITPELTGKLPGYLSPSAGLKFADVPNGLAAISKVPAAGWAQMVAYGAFVELSQDQSAGTAAAAGDFGFKVLTSSDPAEKTKKLSAEIANGRLAMMAIIGMFFQDGLTGSAWGDWALYTASPLRAFNPSAQAGAVAPLGFWDPAGFVKDTDEATFADYRAKEIKHGRVAMLSIVGFLVQPFAESAKIGFEGVPGGVQALTTYPGSVGFACLFIVAGFFELALLPEEKEPGNFGDPLKIADNGFGAYDENWRNFELGNGRLAMIGSIGTIAAGYATGYDAWQQWAGAKVAAIAFIKTTLPFAP